MKNIIVQSDAWSSIPEKNLAKCYADIITKIKFLEISSIITYEPPKNDLTQAENFGLYIRELFEVYSAILEEMKPSRQWSALYTRSTYHSKANYPDSIIINNEESNADRMQVRGFHLDALAFKFTWQDNSMDQPWKPWNWKLGIFTEDMDDTHYFFDLKNDKAFVGTDSKIVFYQMNPNFPQDLKLFHRS